ncbi:MAG TPA: FGGY family carbohydrate kinase [Ktedonobacteraceae bacterium]|nr:FGGY family carbohydrate kinase [Ktedonobacteraceae bacterium]
MTDATNSGAVHTPLILSLDIGTSSVRAMLFDASGAAVPGMVSQPSYELLTNEDGEVAVDADMLVRVVAQSIDEVLAKAGSLSHSIAAVATDTFWHSLVGVDQDNHAIMPLMTWEDTRSRQAATFLRDYLDEAAIHERTGASLHASYWPARLFWLERNRLDIFNRAAQWLSFGEYLHRQFLGRSVCSLSMASGTGMLLIRERTWDLRLAEFLHVRPAQLPALGDIHDGLQGLLPAYASRWPVLNTVPWFPAIGDGAAANAGSGAVTSERWALTVGTSAAIRVVVPPDSIVPPQGLWLYLLDAQRGLFGGALSEGGNLFAWMEQTLRVPKLPEADADIVAMQPCAHGLTILPFLSGERSLGWHADARATISGINVRTTPLDILRAGVESVAYQLNAVYERISTTLARTEPVPMIIGSGGALNGSSSLRQVIADTLGAPLHLSLTHEASARGNALLALETLKILPALADIPLDLAPPLLPDLARHVLYLQGAQRQIKLYHALLGNM